MNRLHATLSGAALALGLLAFTGCSGANSGGLGPGSGGDDSGSPATDSGGGGADSGQPGHDAAGGDSSRPDDGAADGAVDTGTGTDTGAGIDTGVDSGVDTGTDAEIDTGADTGRVTTSCTSGIACGSGGLTYEECTTTSGGGACDGIAYRVSDGTSFSCSSCSNCTAAIQSLDAYCASQVPTTSCTAMTPCESSPLTYESCTTSIGGTCQSSYYQTSDGQTFTCAACGSCSSAVSALDAYCTAQTPPVTTCGTSSACGVGGATYDLCTTSRGGACESKEYTTTTGQHFACNTCSDCTLALTGVETYCASLTGTGQVVLFGGFDSSGAGLGDTWLWNGAAWNPGPVGPSARGDADAAVLGGRLVLFGGTGDTSVTTVLGDTWAWSGTAWTELATTGPSARFGASVATMGSDVVLFGGCSTSTAANDMADTWLWSGSSWSSLAVTGPAARVGAGTAVLNGQMVVFGGMDASSSYLGDTWVFNGSQWVQKTPSVSPPARFYPTMAAVNGQVVLFGGDNGTTLGDMWTWNGSTWTQLTVTGPSARAGAAGTAFQGSLLLFGGSDASGTYVADTWLWNGATWASQSATGPAGRFGASMGAL